MKTRTRFPVLLLAPLVLLLPGCDLGEAGELEVTRTVLPNGATLLRYASLPDTPDAVLMPDLSIGVFEGPPEESFGDVRGIEAGPDGTIYILDYQAREVRSFDAEGRFLTRLARPGDGPGEITSANGLLLDRDGVLWVNDHGKLRFIGIRPDDGTEVTRVPFPVWSFGYVWDGARTEDGRFWMTTSHQESPRVFPPPAGLNEGTSRIYLKWIEPGTEATDSVFIRTAHFRSFVTHQAGGGYGMRSIPFQPGNPLLVDPIGGFWLGDGAGYRIARLAESGDTLLVIEAALDRLPVTDADRAAFLAPMEERGPEDARVGREILDVAAGVKPLFDQLILDKGGRLWVRRVREAGELPFYDLFDREGEYLGSLELGFRPPSHWSPTVRNGHFYSLVLGELDVPTVVRAPLPEGWPD